MTAFCAIVTLLALKSVSGDLIDTTLIQSPKHQLASSDYYLDGLCLHPTANDKIYATSKHALRQIDWSQDPDSATITVVAGVGSSGFVDGPSSSAKFKSPFSCTAYGSKIAIADYSNHAVRSYDPASDTVQTIVARGDGGSTDGQYTGSRTSGAGVTHPSIIEAVNSTHLILVQLKAQIRLIDTNSSTITTLIDIDEYTMNFFLSYDRQGAYFSINNNYEHYDLYYFSLPELLAGRLALNGSTLLVRYEGTNDEWKASNDDNPILHLHYYSGGRDVGDSLITVNEKWLDIIDKRTLSTSVYRELGEPKDVLLVPGNPGVIYVSDKYYLFRLQADGLQAPERVRDSPSEPNIDSTTETASHESTSFYATDFTPSTTVDMTSYTYSSTVTESSTEGPQSTSTADDRHMTTTSLTEKDVSTDLTSDSTGTAGEQRSTASASSTAYPDHLQTESIDEEQTSENSFGTGSLTTEQSVSYQQDDRSAETSIDTQLEDTTASSKQHEGMTRTSEQFEEQTATNTSPDESATTDEQPDKPTTGIHESTTTSEQLYEVTTGHKQYTVKRNALCPSTEIVEQIVEDVQICSLYCSNTRQCAGFNFNKETGKCRLLHPWDKSMSTLTGGSNDRCYERWNLDG